MSRGMIYNTRLMPTEVDRWFDMCSNAGVEVTQATRKAVESFALTDDVLFYVTTINDTMVGGTALFRDRRRLGMAIASVILSPDYRDRLLHNLVKSSLPFFRTAAIRDVDALVAREGASLPDQVPPFPYSFALPTWVRPTLERLEFSPVETIVCGIVQSPFATPDESVTWDSVVDREAAHKLVWDQRHLTGFDSSVLWLSLAVAFKNGAVKTARMDDDDDDEPCLVIGYSIWGKTLLVTPLVWDSDRIDDSVVAAAVVELSQEFGTTEIRIYLRERSRSLLELMSSRSATQEFNLYRKLL